MILKNPISIKLNQIRIQKDTRELLNILNNYNKLAGDSALLVFFFYWFLKMNSYNEVN